MKDESRLSDNRDSDATSVRVDAYVSLSVEPEIDPRAQFGTFKS